MPKQKTWTYFNNNKKNTMPKAKANSSTVNVVVDVIIVFFIVILISVCLRIVNDTFFASKYNPFHINTAYAADDQADLVSQSHSYVNLKPEVGFTFTLKYKNTGSTVWNGDDVYLKSKTTALKFSHEFWPDPYHPAKLQEESVAPGEVGTFVFALEAPENYNEYTGDFVLVNNNVLISGGEAMVTLNVVADPSKVSPQPTTVTTDTTTTTTPTTTTTTQEYCTLNFRMANLIDGTTGVDTDACVPHFNFSSVGPMMRVGLFYSENIITIKNKTAWQIKNSNGTVLANVPAAVEVSFFYNETTKEYSYEFSGQSVKTTSYLTMPNPTGGMFTITSYHNIPSYNPNIDYNDFIGELEIRHNDSKDRTWVIEILPMETYLKGIQETTNYDPIEYLKTMSVAARTYASYHYDRYSKHADEFFHVDSRYDQVYKGYVSMLLFPRVGEAVDATTGIVATYDDKVIVAPYFSHSDGRTRSYEEVWVYEVPYLVSVEAPYSEGKTLFGHGVGIDAYDALKKAEHDGWTFDELLKYYYTNIKLEQIW